MRRPSELLRTSRPGDGKFVTWTFLSSRVSLGFNMQHGTVLVPESQRRIFNLVIMCTFSSTLPIFHSKGRVSSWGALGYKWVRQWNIPVRLSPQNKRRQSTIQADGAVPGWKACCLIVAQGMLNYPSTRSARLIDTRKPYVKKNSCRGGKCFWLECTVDSTSICTPALYLISSCELIYKQIIRGVFSYLQR